MIAPLPFFLVAVVSCLGTLPARARDAALVPVATLTLPDGSTLTLPSDGKVSVPSNICRPPSPAPVSPPSAGPPPGSASREAGAGAQATPAERRHQRIDALFARLAVAQDATEATAIGTAIDRLWLQSGSPTADLLMQRAVTAMGAKNETTATALLDKVILLRPEWAEAWNKRATARYLADDDAGSMEDISHVLALEPRHFGALGGMGTILHRNGDDKAALTVLRRALAVDPQQPEIKALVDQITPDVEGHDL